MILLNRWGYFTFRIQPPIEKETKMRKAPKGTWFIDEEIQQAQYINKIHEAVLPGQVKDFLKTIAGVATWRKTNNPEGSYVPCYASEDTLAAYLGRGGDYVTKWKKKAEELGWIYVVHNYPHSDWIWPLIGEDDPTMEKREPRDKSANWRPKIKPVIQRAEQDIPNK